MFHQIHFNSNNLSIEHFLKDVTLWSILCHLKLMSSPLTLAGLSVLPNCLIPCTISSAPVSLCTHTTSLPPLSENCFLLQDQELLFCCFPFCLWFSFTLFSFHLDSVQFLFQSIISQNDVTCKF